MASPGYFPVMQLPGAELRLTDCQGSFLCGTGRHLNWSDDYHFFVNPVLKKRQRSSSQITTAS